MEIHLSTFPLSAYDVFLIRHQIFSSVWSISGPGSGPWGPPVPEASAERLDLRRKSFNGLPKNLPGLRGFLRPAERRAEEEADTGGGAEGRRMDGF